MGDKNGMFEAHLTLCNVFWRANLTCHPYIHGDPKVKFEELWPNELQLSELLKCLCSDGFQHQALAYCTFALRCGPARMLQVLLKEELMNLNDLFNDGKSLLHVACLSSNTEAVSLLINEGISLKTTDKKGQTADQMCFCLQTRKELPARFQTSSLKVNRKQVANAEDKQIIFKLIRDPEAFEDLQVMLQTLAFDVNSDKDDNGDLLIHKAVQQGISHLALIMNLVLVHDADVEAVDHNRMTPLCIAAKLGYEIITEVLMCVMGADPNAYSILNLWTPLHYAAKTNSVSVIECLARRGADLNAEDRFGFRADDISKMVDQDSKDLIENLRFQRCHHLAKLAKKGNLSPHIIRPSDMYIVDSEGHTLVMIAAMMNRCDNLMVLLHNERCPIDAQNAKNGQTALSLAAMLGKADAVQTLLRYGAHPGIADMKGMLPLHYACVNVHVLCVQTIVNVPSGLTGLLKAMKCTDEPEIRSIIEEAKHRRQKTIVNPTLFECAMNGDANRLYSIMEEGDDANPLTGTGDWPLYMAAGNRYLEIMQLLHVNGGDICSHHQTTGSTVLHIACSRGLYHIVSYLLKVSNCSTVSTTCESGVSECDINATNFQGQTALQVAAEKGYSHIVHCLLSYGATSALIDSFGQLYKCSEYEGVQVLIEHHQRSRTELITSYIKNTKNVHHLRKIWQWKYDHNLRNCNGDTPLMIACLNGRTEVVKFLLKSAIQSMENEQDFEMSVEREKRDCFVDSGAFDESHPGCNTKTLATVDEDGIDLDTSVTDLSDLDTGSERATCMQHDRHSRIKGFSSSVNLGSTCRHPTRHSTLCRSYESESLDDSTDDSYSDAFKNPTNYQRLVSDRKALSTNDLGKWQSIGSLTIEKGPQWSFLYGLTNMDCTARNPGLPHTNTPRIYKGTSVNHLCAVNKHDGCTAMHRAVQCINEKRGLQSLLFLFNKDPSVVNLQNFKGLTPLHIAAKTDKKLIVKTIVHLHTVDLNLRTRDGKLAEDMIKSKRIARVIRTARQYPTNQRFLSPSGIEEPPTLSQGNVGGSSIDFDKLEERFKKLSKSNSK